MNESLAKYVQKSYQTFPIVKEKLDKAGVAPSEIRTIADLQKVPITRKDDFFEMQRANPQRPWQRQTRSSLQPPGNFGCAVRNKRQ